MAKELEVNNNTAQNQQRQPQQKPGDKRNQQKLQGKAFQVNENSVEDQEPARSPAHPQQSSDKRNQSKPEGKAFQVNENSVEDQEPARSPAPTRQA
ncbi:hypothetical protein [Mesorhizobium kowhaii]|uniref:Uncharacterized protein n=1 Tax=Mesorhizobium kowhaii TaxID=1300272 RepID=A0A2W7BZD7_9HYPH|nr:hypothetical protein [Mesorhizobium kowhaii]PZV35934.1 hypothetical protein B5V02_24530 [Mesorhizobium kowhaii]